MPTDVSPKKKRFRLSFIISLILTLCSSSYIFLLAPYVLEPYMGGLGSWYKYVHLTITILIAPFFLLTIIFLVLWIKPEKIDLNEDLS
ncbi:MAG: hypothetical protein FK733_04490 [Asgard group archaeon]|nr:hypothetical protein [Asgard group archaeon]